MSRHQILVRVKMDTQKNLILSNSFSSLMFPVSWKEISIQLIIILLESNNSKICFWKDKWLLNYALLCGCWHWLSDIGLIYGNIVSSEPCWVAWLKYLKDRLPSRGTWTCSRSQWEGHVQCALAQLNNDSRGKSSIFFSQQTFRLHMHLIEQHLAKQSGKSFLFG